LTQPLANISPGKHLCDIISANAYFLVVSGTKRVKILGGEKAQCRSFLPSGVLKNGAFPPWAIAKQLIPKALRSVSKEFSVEGCHLKEYFTCRCRQRLGPHLLVPPSAPAVLEAAKTLTRSGWAAALTAMEFRALDNAAALFSHFLKEAKLSHQGKETCP
jgi:hypothetical protein